MRVSLDFLGKLDVGLEEEYSHPTAVFVVQGDVLPDCEYVVAEYFCDSDTDFTLFARFRGENENDERSMELLIVDEPAGLAEPDELIERIREKVKKL